MNILLYYLLLFSFRNQRKYLSIALKVIAILSALFSQINYWNISLIISVSVFMVSAQHILELNANNNLKCD